MTLVREFATGRSDPAFTVLVERHVGLVHSAALRLTGGDAHLAQEITQAVFIILARKAATLGPKTILAAWLYRTTRFVAADALKIQRRRVAREQEAYMQSTLNDLPADEAWSQVAPLLDDALNELGETDRAALVLRFFENKTAREIAEALRMEESAAHKRVARALEKLRALFVKRGVTFSAVIIAGAIGANSVQAAPAGMANMISAAAVAKGAAAGSSTITLVKGALKLMAWSKTKVAIAVGIGLALTAATTAITLKTVLAPATQVLYITGKGQIELFTSPSEIVANADFSILTDGKSYRISVMSKGRGKLTNDVYDLQADYASDGADMFVSSDQGSPLNRTRTGRSGFAYPGRVLGRDFFVSLMAQEIWLAYCSRDYYTNTSRQTGFVLEDGISPVWPGYATNLVDFWPGTTFPKSITTWSRNKIMQSRSDSSQPLEFVELTQYPAGFKAWKFSTANPTNIGGVNLPQAVTLETFFPRPPDTATTGDDTQPLRKATFVTDKIEIVKGGFDPLPPVSVPDLKVMDWRFKDIAGNFVIESHATPAGWPVRGSKGFAQAAAQAAQIAATHKTDMEAYRREQLRNQP